MKTFWVLNFEQETIDPFEFKTFISRRIYTLYIPMVNTQNFTWKYILGHLFDREYIGNKFRTNFYYESWPSGVLPIKQERIFVKSFACRSLSGYVVETYMALLAGTQWAWQAFAANSPLCRRWIAIAMWHNAEQELLNILKIRFEIVKVNLSDLNFKREINETARFSWNLVW